MTREITFEIRGQDSGKKLVDFLSARFTYRSRDEWAAQIVAGRMTVNGRQMQGDEVLHEGDVLRYDAADIPEPPVDDAFGVVSDDPLLMVVDKTGNLPCHPGGRYFNHTLWALLKTRHGLPSPVLVNRIDRETSGLVLVAKTPQAAHNLRSQFAAHSVRKRYTVMVEGRFSERVEASGWLLPDPSSVIRKKRCFVPAEKGQAAPCPEAEWAETVFECQQVCAGFSVVDAAPRTGRLHQLRATLCSLGYPVVGDKVYGVDDTLFVKFCNGELSDADRARLRMARQALHAGSLGFRHPRFGTPTEVTAPLPADMAALIAVNPS